MTEFLEDQALRLAYEDIEADSGNPTDGPLAQQFSQAADAMTCHTTPIMSGGLIGGMTHDPALCSGCRGRAALSAIERHVQDMEKALEKIISLMSSSEESWEDPVQIARAALPAREKEEE